MLHAITTDLAQIGVATFSGGSLRASIVPRDLVCEPLAPPLPADANCLVGQWFATSMTLPPGPDQISAIGGAGTLIEFFADGTGIIDFTGMEPILVQFRGPDHGEIITSGTRFSGSSGFTYTVTDGVLGGSELDGSGIRVIATMAVDNLGQGPNVPEQEVINTTLAELMAMAGGLATSPGVSGSSVTCTPGQLTLTRNDPAGTGIWSFERVR